MKEQLLTLLETIKIVFLFWIPLTHNLSRGLISIKPESL